MARRVAVFIDYQNVYRRAQSAFSSGPNHHTFGQIDPRKLGDLLVGRVPNGALAFVRVYRGQPDANRDPKGSAACSRQVAAWRTRANVEVFTRPLRYPPGYPAEKPSEKGIDVQLAIDFVVAALDDRFDVGVVVSADTDLKPAIETVLSRTELEVAVATWQGPSGRASRISLPDRKIWCHYLHEQDFRAVQDPTDYTRA
jgi:hypothetical protein